MRQTRAPEVNSARENVQISIVHDAANNSDLGSQRLIPCIYKVPEELHTLKNSAYEPRVVSIGPIHSDDNRLKAMEDIKLSYTQSLVSRTAGESRTVKLCEDAMKELEVRVKNCYDEILTKFDRSPAGMMFIDGCFILELLYKFKHELGQDDPIFCSPVRLRAFRHDLLLLENQIPFFVLEKLFSLTVKCIPYHRHDLSLTDYALPFFSNILKFEKGILTKKDNTYVYHILHLLHKCYLRSHDRLEGEKDHNRFPSASDLDLAGVNFVEGAEDDLFDVTFTKPQGLFRWWHSASFKIPTLSIYDETEPLLRNLIAFEQCCPTVPLQISSYCFFMDTLINSPEDVKLLENAGILRNYLGSSQDVSNLFNNICKEVAVGNSYFENAYVAARNHCQELWPRFLASLKRDYFANPWSGIAVFAAIIIFGLTIVQTIYTVRSYY